MLSSRGDASTPIVSLNTKKDEALEEKFLSSFTLPERGPDPPKNAATAANQAEQQQPQNEQTIDNRPPEPNQAKAQGEQGRPEETPNPNADPNAANNSGNQQQTGAAQPGEPAETTRFRRHVEWQSHLPADT